jgi:hypothetical protein
VDVSKANALNEGLGKFGGGKDFRDSTVINRSELDRDCDKISTVLYKRARQLVFSWYVCPFFVRK